MSPYMCALFFSIQKAFLWITSPEVSSWKYNLKVRRTTDNNSCGIEVNWDSATLNSLLTATPLVSEWVFILKYSFTWNVFRHVSQLYTYVDIYVHIHIQCIEYKSPLSEYLICFILPQFRQCLLTRNRWLPVSVSITRVWKWCSAFAVWVFSM